MVCNYVLTKNKCKNYHWYFRNIHQLIKLQDLAARSLNNVSSSAKWYNFSCSGAFWLSFWDTLISFFMFREWRSMHVFTHWKKKKKPLTSRLQSYRRSTVSIYFSFIIAAVTNYGAYGNINSLEVKICSLKHERVWKNIKVWKSKKQQIVSKTILM